ncbi:metal-dependent hydrolase [candidate division KSB1 bacterium]|nr:metal-dependent hydrolase [candidate division KSB1 bacterium]
MPLPLGHSLMGYTIAAGSRFKLSPNVWMNIFIFALLANLPDIDYLPGYLKGLPNRYHHHEIHSLGFAALMGLVGGLVYLRMAGKFWACFLPIFFAVSSHLLLDLVTEDFSEPHGMMLLWPLNSEFYDVSWKIFKSVNKSNHSADFFSSLFTLHNLRVVLIELMIMLPLALAATFVQRRRRAAETQPQRKEARAAKRLTVQQSVETEQELGAALTAAQITELPQIDYQRIDLNQPGYRNGKS